MQTVAWFSGSGWDATQLPPAHPGRMVRLLCFVTHHRDAHEEEIGVAGFRPPVLVLGSCPFFALNAAKKVRFDAAKKLPVSLMRC